MGTITIVMETDSGSPFVDRLHVALGIIEREKNKVEDVQAVVEAAKKLYRLSLVHPADHDSEKVYAVVDEIITAVRQLLYVETGGNDG